MEMQVVSQKLLLLCMSVSVGLLMFIFIQNRQNADYMYLCNERDVIDIYVRQDSKDIVYTPQNIKNILTCLGRGMPYYDRTIDVLAGIATNPEVLEIKKRYTIKKITPTSSGPLNTYICIGEKKNKYLIIQKELTLNNLLISLKACDPLTIVLAEKYKGTDITKALKSLNYKIEYVSVGRSNKILL